MKIFPALLLILVCASSLAAQIQGSPFIRLDQFGYLPESKKVAVIADPVNGFDAALSFSPGNLYEVVQISTGQVVFS